MVREDIDLRAILEEASAERNALARRLLAVLEGTEAHVASLRRLQHDLRNALAVLGAEKLRLEHLLANDHPGRSELLDDHQWAVSECASATESLGEAGRHALTEGGVRFEPLDLPAFAGRVGRRLNVLMQNRGVSTTATTTPAAPPTVEIDPLILECVVDNLLWNAMQVTRQGRIELTFDGEGVDWLLVEVRDTGPGLPAPVLETLRDGDLSALARRDGHGVGLRIVVDFLRHVGGRLHVRTEAGAGTRMMCRIPVRPQRALSSSGVRQSTQLVTVHGDARAAASGGGQRR